MNGHKCQFVCGNYPFSICCASILLRDTSGPIISINANVHRVGLLKNHLGIVVINRDMLFFMLDLYILNNVVSEVFAVFAIIL